MMNAPVFPHVAARFGVSPRAVRKAELRVVRRRREETGDLLNCGGTDRDRGQPGFPVTHGAVTVITTRTSGPYSVETFSFNPISSILQ
jgi:hypothetical protein